MADISIRFEGVSAIIAALEAKKAAIDVATRQATDESGRRLQSDARGNFRGAHPPGFWHLGGPNPNTVSGDLQASIQFLTPTIKEGPARYSNRSGPTSLYSRVIELGAVIEPKIAKVLHWFDAQYGIDRYKKSVTIPPHPFFIPARMTLPPRMESIFYGAWREAWSE